MSRLTLTVNVYKNKNKSQKISEIFVILLSQYHNLKSEVCSVVNHIFSILLHSNQTPCMHLLHTGQLCVAFP